jgi:hypothetical protein
MHNSHAAHHVAASNGGMSTHGAVAAGEGEGASHHHAPSSKQCTCLGACCCAPTISAPIGAVATLPAERTVEVRVVTTWTTSDLTLSAVEYAHPFANGPPSRV